ncbi:MAG: glycosyltransferase family 2 protein [Lachnospiraceae bacterium]|nr:glycosyltransferase family 2 protein [Lachnospiraceae bacterium]
MKTKKAIILLSTYNGEAYIGEQLESLLEQTHSNLEIWIRDDGSTDKTVEVIERFQDDRIHLERGRNIGYPEGFFRLLSGRQKGDYFFFCDQDDRWHADKVERAVAMLEREESNRPVLYASAFDYCDENLKILRKSDPVKKNWKLKDVCYQCLTWGFTMAMNRCARDFLADNLPPGRSAKDSWLLLICTAFGKIVYDETSTAFYRRHGSTTSFGGSGRLALARYRIQHFLKGDSLEKSWRLLEDFDSLFGKKLPVPDQRMLRMFVNREKKILIQIKKVFYPHRLRSRPGDEIQLRLLFLLGKL